MDALQKLKDLAVSDSGFVFDPCTGATFTVNATGRAIIEAIKAGQDRAAILATLEQSFDLAGAGESLSPPVDLDRDLNEFMHLLRTNGLVPDELAL